MLLRLPCICDWRLNMLNNVSHHCLLLYLVIILNIRCSSVLLLALYLACCWCFLVWGLELESLAWYGLIFVLRSMSHMTVFRPSVGSMSLSPRFRSDQGGRLWTPPSNSLVLTKFERGAPATQKWVIFVYVEMCVIFVYTKVHVIFIYA